MANENLADYLNDHSAGSVAAVELLEFLEKQHEGTEVGKFAASLRAEVEADRQELKALINRLNIGESITRKTSAWLAGKVAELKLWLDSSDGDFLLFESLEALSLGIEGKRLLWLALANVAKDDPALQGPDYERLIQRAEEQRGKVDERRLVVSTKALDKAGKAQGSSS
ncbi:MAG TPA: hypothetical protein VMM84_16570 [Pyrinomonadaceae bacterium]|nr:hypothetical protein [Pyrinomonadaceae bacterium]